MHTNPASTGAKKSRHSTSKGTSMKRRLTASALLAGLAIAPLAGIPAGTATAQTVYTPSQNIVLSIGRGELIAVPGNMTDVFIANEAIADVQVKSQRQLYLFGRAGGETTVYASNAAGDVIWSANVRVGSNIDSIDQMLALAMPEASVSVATMGTNTVLLTGTVAAPDHAAEAERLVQAFVGEEMNVISRLKMATPLQVNLQVRFAEVNRTFFRNIGANLTTIDGSSGFRFGIGNGRPLAQGEYSVGGPLGVGAGIENPAFVLPDGTEIPGPGVQTTGNGTTIAGLGRFLGLDILGALDLAEQSGLVSTLAQPNLTALSGETATFLAGGEFPYEQAQGLGTTSIQFKPYGISLAYAPVVLENGRISLRLSSEVSELDFSINPTVPALTTRRAETTVELGSGQSFMIAGLMSNKSQHTIDKAPGAGDVPILGNLFRSRSFRKGETELVIVVTPYLVTPVNPNEIRLPTDGFRTATELQSFLGFQESDGISGGERPGPVARDRDAPPPAVSRIDPGAVLPGANQERGDRRTARKTSKDGKSAAAAPGFSLK